MLMWDYYINAMLEINTDLTTHVLLRTRALNHAFESAYERNKMNENHCVEYVELLHAHDPEQELILQVNEMIPSLKTEIHPPHFPLYSFRYLRQD